VVRVVPVSDTIVNTHSVLALVGSPHHAIANGTGVEEATASPCACVESCAVVVTRGQVWSTAPERVKLSNCASTYWCGN